MTSRIITYFSTGLVLLFIHSNVHFHVILLNMKHYIFSVVNILIYLTYLSLLFISHHFLFVTYLHLFLRSLVSLHLPEDVTQFSKNASWFPCRRSFSEKCSSSGLLCNHFSCFQWQFFSFWLLLFEWKESQFQIQPQTGYVDFIWFYWLDIWVMMEFSQSYRLMRLAVSPILII